MSPPRVEMLQTLESDVMEAETVFVLAIFTVFLVVGASLVYYACCVTDNEEAVKKIRESLKRKRSHSSSSNTSNGVAGGKTTSTTTTATTSQPPPSSSSSNAAHAHSATSSALHDRPGARFAYANRDEPVVSVNVVPGAGARPHPALPPLSSSTSAIGATNMTVGDVPRVSGHHIGIQVAPPTPEVFQPPPEFSEGSSSSLSPNCTPPPEEATAMAAEAAVEHRNSIDCSHHSNVLSVLLQEYLTSIARAKAAGSHSAHGGAGGSSSASASPAMSTASSSGVAYL